MNMQKIELFDKVKDEIKKKKNRIKFLQHIQCNRLNYLIRLKIR